MSDVVTNGKCYVARSRKIAARTLGHETMIMSALDSSLFTLNETASAIWNASDGQTPLDQIVEQHVSAVFDVEPEQALRDAQELVNGLVQHGVMLVSDSPISEGA
ncbi:MAG: PqqD family protein [Acidobacteriota bacterium]|nr:PqqD family protein [Acidobacteriota bacterium]